MWVICYCLVRYAFRICDDSIHLQRILRKPPWHFFTYICNNGSMNECKPTGPPVPLKPMRMATESSGILGTLYGLPTWCPSPMVMSLSLVLGKETSKWEYPLDPKETPLAVFHSVVGPQLQMQPISNSINIKQKVTSQVHGKHQ